LPGNFVDQSAALSQPVPPPKANDSSIVERNNISNKLPNDLLNKLRRDSDMHVKYLSWIMQQYTKCRSARAKEERKWYLALAFFFGQQNAMYLPVGSTAGAGGAGTRLYVPPAPYYRARPVTNLIRPAVRKEVATLTSTKPSVSVIPATSDDRDLFAAQAGEQIWESMYRRKKLRAVFRRATWWSVVCGTSYVQSIWDDSSVDADSDQQGDICYNVLTPFHLLVPDLMEEEIESEPYVIHVSAMDLEAAKIKYAPYIGDINIVPDTAAAADIISDSFLNLIGSVDAKRSNVLCIDIWVKPGTSKLLPDGGYLCVVGGQIIQASEGWPYEHNRYPFSKLDYISSGRYYGEGMITDLIPLQREYNRTRGQIIEAKNRMAKPQLMAQRGSIEPNMITTEPGQVILYSAGYPAPQPLPLTPLPSYVLNELEVIKADFQDISGQHDIASGKVPPGVTSATAISFLQEQDDSMRATGFDNLEEMIESVGYQTLCYVNQYWDTKRKVKVVGNDGSFDVLALSGSDIDGNTDIVVEAGSALPTSKAAKQAFIMDLMKMNFIDPQKGMEVMEMGGISKIYEDVQVDVMQARRENLKMQAINQQMLSAYLQTFVATDPLTRQPIGLYDPNTQQPLQPGENPPPMVPVNTFDNHQVHIDVHNKFRKGQAFENLPPEIKQIFEQHVAMHQKALQAQMLPPMGGPQLSGGPGGAPQVPGGAIQGAGMTQNPLTQEQGP
jgi:hypothetical protein